MPFGGETLTFVSREVGPGPSDERGNKPIVETRVKASGCRHRPLTFQETAELQFDIATEFWRSTIPIGEYGSSLRSKVMGIEPDAAIEIAGQQYQVIGGIRSHPDMEGRPFKATIISKKHIG